MWNGHLMEIGTSGQVKRNINKKALAIFLRDAVDAIFYSHHDLKLDYTSLIPI